MRNITLRQCKQAMLRGQGRALEAVRREPEEYRPLVLWACGNEIAFDPQTEGSRAWYIYQMIRAYDERRPFLEALVESLRKTRPNGGWKTLYLAELLKCFAEDGEEAAGKALWEKYEALLAALLRKTRKPQGPFFHARDDFGMLCVLLANRRDKVVKIAADIGRLYRKQPFHDGLGFDRFYSEKAARHKKALLALAAASADVEAYLRVSEAFANKRAASDTAARGGTGLAGYTGIALSRRLRRNADRETVIRYAEAYLCESDPKKRAAALRAFCLCPFPLDPKPLLEDAVSGCAPLREAAWAALAYVRHPAVRAFALSMLDTDKEAALPIFITNYQKEDEALLTALVQSIRVD